MPEKPRLAVLIDNVPLGDEESRALWTKFSEHMDTHRGDFAGFAKQHGYYRVSPEARNGQAVLVIYTTEAASRPRPVASRPQPAAASKKKRKR